MSSSGVGNLTIIDGIMNKEVYLNILKQNLQQSAEKLGIVDTYHFQQDNDPKHTATNVKLWIAYNTPHMLVTPPQNLNPIEHLWDVLEKRLRKHNITSKTHLKELPVSEWQLIGSDVTRKLVNSMPNRLKEVIRLKGFPTKY